MGAKRHSSKHVSMTGHIPAYEKHVMCDESSVLDTAVQYRKKNGGSFYDFLFLHGTHPKGIDLGGCMSRVLYSITERLFFNCTEYTTRWMVMRGGEMMHETQGLGKKIPPRLQKKNIVLKMKFFFLLCFLRVSLFGLHTPLGGSLEHHPFFLRQVHLGRMSGFFFPSSGWLPWPPSCCLDESTLFVGSDERPSDPAPHPIPLQSVSVQRSTQKDECL